MARLTVNDTALEYQDVGRGDSLVLVHGSASDYRAWDFQREVFAQSFRVVSYSRRYHWPNDPIPDGVDYSMHQHVEDLAALIRSLDAAPTHLVGHSYGAFVCLLAASREPALIQTLALAEPPVVTLFVSNRPTPAELIKLSVSQPRTAVAVVRFGAFGAVPAQKAFLKGDDQRGLRIFGNAVLGSSGFERLSETRKAQIQDNLSNVKAEILGTGFPSLAAAELQAVGCPVLLMTGERSVKLFHRIADRLAALLPDVTRVEIAGATHMMHEENPSAFNEAVRSFIDGGGDESKRSLSR